MANPKSTPAKTTQSGEVTRIQSGKVTRMTPFEQFKYQIQNEAELTKEFSSDNIAADVIGRILEAETLEDAFKAQDSGLQNGKDYVDVEITVHDFEVRPSDSKYSEHSAIGVYVKVVGVKLENGESVQFFTGAPNVVALLWKARRDNKLPLDCVIKSKETANGELLTLRPLPKRVIRN